MKIGIMGGTFDPIHIGHLLLGEFAYEDFGLDEIWFLPNGNPPHKSLAEVTPGVMERVEMVRKAIQGVPYFKVSEYEAIENAHSYTYRTMQHFSKTYPQHQFYFILGADSLFAIEQWKYFREIFPTCTILAAMRDDKDRKDMEDQIRYLEETYQAKIELLQAPLLEISSTTIRNRAGNGYTVRYMVPDTVAQYIREKGFYKRGKSENTGQHIVPAHTGWPPELQAQFVRKNHSPPHPIHQTPVCFLFSYVLSPLFFYNFYREKIRRITPYIILRTFGVFYI